MNATLNCCLPDKKMQQVALESLYWQTLHERIFVLNCLKHVKIRSFPTRLSDFFFFWGGRSSLVTCRRPKPSYETNSTVQRVQSFDLKTAGFCWVKGIVKQMMRWKITWHLLKRTPDPGNDHICLTNYGTVEWMICRTSLSVGYVCLMLWPRASRFAPEVTRYVASCDQYGKISSNYNPQASSWVCRPVANSLFSPEKSSNLF